MRLGYWQESPPVFPKNTLLQDLPAMLAKTEAAWVDFLSKLTDADLQRQVAWVAVFDNKRYAWHLEGILTQVNGHAWYTYGASTTAGRDLRPSNAVQWQMIRDARSAGAQTYDMRGITDTLDPDDHLFGLLQFKVGTGGYAQEYAGEWDYAIRPALTRAFEAYMRRR